MEDPPTGDNIVRTTYRLAGQIVVVQKKVGSGRYHSPLNRENQR
jgi:hypothetical protein